MRNLALTAALVIGVIGMFGPAPHFCAGALHAQASPERKTPPGEWCQRQAPQMDRKAHACACHQHDCSKPDEDTYRSAHTDAQCLNYCTTSQCRCSRDDCP